MLPQDSEKTERNFQSCALIISSLISGCVVWDITGTSNFYHIPAKPLTETQVFIGWLFLPIILISALFCNLVIVKLFFKKKTWFNQIFTSIVAYNICYYFFQFIKDFFIESRELLFSRMDFFGFLIDCLLINSLSLYWLTFVFTICAFVSKFFLKKNLQ